jgi:hypothetical protein
VPTLAVLNFDFVKPFAVPFRFQNVTRRVTGFDCFQYTSRQVANRNVGVRPTRGYGYNESGQQSQATRYVHRQECYLGPVSPGKQMAHANHGCWAGMTCGSGVMCHRYVVVSGFPSVQTTSSSIAAGVGA